MVKCEPCSKLKCRNKYENRHYCNDSKNCTCSCQQSSGFWKSLGSIALGTAAFADGVILTVSTGGLGAVGIAAVLGGGALTGTGATAVIHPIAKKINGERMEYGMDYVKEVAIGGAIGVLTAGISSGGASITTSIASKVGTEGIKQGAVKFACRSVVGAVCGATASVVQELSSPGKFSVGNVVKGAIFGAVMGGVTHATSNVTRHLESGILKSVVKVVANTGTTVAVDSAAQLIEDGEIDGKRLTMNAVVTAATSSAHEVVKNVTYKAHGGKEALQGKISDKQILAEMEPKDKKVALESKGHLEKMSYDDVKKEVELASQSTDAKNELKKMKNNLEKLDKEYAGSNKRINEIAQSTNLKEADKRIQLQTEQDNKSALSREQRRLSRQYNRYINTEIRNLEEPAKMGDRNIHALDSNHIKQFAADLPNPNANGLRGKRRVIFDVHLSDDNKKFRVSLAGKIDNHNYDEVPKYGEVTLPEINNAKPILLPITKKEEERKKKNE